MSIRKGPGFSGMQIDRSSQEYKNRMASIASVSTIGGGYLNRSSTYNGLGIHRRPASVDGRIRGDSSQGRRRAKRTTNKINIGDTIKCHSGVKGVVKFQGPVLYFKEIKVGIEIISEHKGDCNGTYDGKNILKEKEKMFICSI
eukprot:UN02270